MTARPTALHLPVHDAVVLAGGQGRRLGGLSKAEVPVAGVAMIDRVLLATTGARHVVIVGPPELARPGIPTTLEQPASGGPVAGIAAGLAALASTPGGDDASTPASEGDGPVLVLACDVPRVAGVETALFGALAAAPEADGAHLVDAEGHSQLVAVYRRDALAGALAGLGGGHGISVRRLNARLSMVAVADPDGHGQDADTWDDVRHLDAVISRGEGVTEHDLEGWVRSAGRELGVDPDGVDVDLLLALAREVAHGVARPAVPLTGFLVGYAVGRGDGDRATLERVVGRVTELVHQWSVADGADAAPAPAAAADDVDGDPAP